MIEDGCGSSFGNLFYDSSDAFHGIKFSELLLRPTPLLGSIDAANLIVDSASKESFICIYKV
jgi:hypothetical protein